MSFELGQATRVEDARHIGMVASAFKKKGKPVALVPLRAGVHAGHLSLIAAAKRIRGAIVIVAYTGADEEDFVAFARAGVDAVFAYSEDTLWPRGLRTTVLPVDHGLEDPAVIGREVAWHLALLGVVKPTDVVVGEKDFEVLLGLQRAVTDFHLGVRVQGVPTVRMADGVPMSLRNTQVPADAREQASALSAALTAGAHAAEGGERAVREVVDAVLQAAGITPEYVELRALDGGPAPEQGDARLFAAATIGGVRLLDNVGLPLGIGFKNIGEDGGAA